MAVGLDAEVIDIIRETSPTTMAKIQAAYPKRMQYEVYCSVMNAVANSKAHEHGGKIIFTDPSRR